jgi:hypothetical protein
MTNNPFEALSEDNKEEVEMEDMEVDVNCNSSDAMPKKDNAQIMFSREYLSEEGFATALSKCSQRKIAQAAKEKKEKTKEKFPFLLSKRSQDNLEWSKKAKEALTNTKTVNPLSDSGLTNNTDEEKEQEDTVDLESTEKEQEDSNEKEKINAANVLILEREETTETQLRKTVISIPYQRKKKSSQEGILHAAVNGVLIQGLHLLQEILTN